LGTQIMHEVKRIMWEFVFIGAAGLLVGFMANYLSAYGLSLSYDYLGKAKPAPKTQPVVDASNDSQTLPDPDSDAGQGTKPKLTPQGFQVISHEDMVKLYKDFVESGTPCLIIDARPKMKYKSAHVPGAYNLDPYPGRYTEEQLNEILEYCFSVTKVVIYCTSDDCDDSEVAASLLMDNGIDWNLIYIYDAGITKWKSTMSFEIGQRDSGNIMEGSHE